MKMLAQTPSKNWPSVVTNERGTAVEEQSLWFERLLSYAEQVLFALILLGWTVASGWLALTLLKP
jgi:hypothetical protein